MAGPESLRLDLLLLERGHAETRNVARGLVMAGRVKVEGVVRDKPGTLVARTAHLEVEQPPPFVSRAGEKLAHALEVFELDVSGARALDVGASTGGFTDCLLKAGASEVIALDVGYGQLDQRLREDPRVHVLERVNARHLEAEALPYGPDLLTADVSFISLKKVLPPVVELLAPGYRAVVLVKPQFEAGRELVGKKGIVRDPAVHAAVLRDLVRFVSGTLPADVRGVSDSGLPGVGGNREFFVYFGRGGGPGPSLATLDGNIARVAEVDN